VTTGRGVLEPLRRRDPDARARLLPRPSNRRQCEPPARSHLVQARDSSSLPAEPERSVTAPRKPGRACGCSGPAGVQRTRAMRDVFPSTRPGSLARRCPGSVNMSPTFARISSGVAVSAMAFPSDLLAAAVDPRKPRRVRQESSAFGQQGPPSEVSGAARFRWSARSLGPGHLPPGRSWHAQQ
jgi:hypothetical protein